MISPEKIAEMLDAAEKATPGPWAHGTWGGRCHRQHRHGTKEDPCVYEHEFYEGINGISTREPDVTVIGSDYDGLAAEADDLDFIALCDPATITEILSEFLQLRAERDEAREVLKQAIHDIPSIVARFPSGERVRESVVRSLEAVLERSTLSPEDSHG